MVPAGNKVKRIFSVNHTKKKIYRHHYYDHLHAATNSPRSVYIKHPFQSLRKGLSQIYVGSG